MQTEVKKVHLSISVKNHGYLGKSELFFGRNYMFT